MGAAAADAALAASLAGRAGRLLRHVRATVGFADPARLRDAGDCRSHQLLVRLLARARPGDAVLSEEGADDPARLGAERLWIVDPLDGTREFAERDRDDWAVHVALWQAGALVAGAVALPARGLVAATDPPPPPPAPRAPVRVLCSRTRAPALVAEVAAALGAETVPMGSAGAKVMALVRGEADVYLHDGGQWEWDSAAPVAVATAAGLHASRLDGRPLRYNQARPYLPDLLVCRAELAARVLAVTSAATAAAPGRPAARR